MAHRILREWTLHEEIGHEGVATVYRATHAHMAGEFAVRVIDPEVVPDEEARERFLRRAALAAELSSPIIRRVELPFEERGVFYAPAEQLKGETLADRLDRKPEAWSTDAALDLVAQIAAALAHAHERRVVHPGLDPSEVWLEDDGRRVKVAGFGESASRRERSWSREPGADSGYRAPEVREGQGPSAAADVYAAGAILFRLLAGTPPQDRRLGAVKPDAPRWLDELVSRMTARIVAERPSDGKALVALISSERASSAHAPGYGAGPSAYGAGPAAPPDAGAPRPKPTSANIVIPLLVVAFLAGVGGLALGFMASGNPLKKLSRLTEGEEHGPTPVAHVGSHERLDPAWLAPLRGRKVWVQVPTPSDTEWCDHFRNAGLIVNCDTDNADQVNYDLIVRCPDLPANTFEMIEGFLGRGENPRRYDWREQNKCGQYHEITVEIPIEKDQVVAPSEAQPSEVAPAVPVKRDGPQFDPQVLASLKGRKVWVQVPGPADAWYCDKFRAAGLIVECDTDNADQEMFDLIVRCNTLPANTFDLLEAFLKLPVAARRYEWREENACGQYHEITVEIPPEREKRAPDMAQLPEKTKPGQYDPAVLAAVKGRKVWVQVPTPADRAWCDLFEDAGLMVTCDTDNADQVKYDLIARCPNLPKDLFAKIETFVGLDVKARRYDWREENACGQYHEITVEIPIMGDAAEAQQAPSEVAPAVPVKETDQPFDPEVLAALKGRKVWVQVPGPADSWYCDKFRAAGLIVDCDTNNPDQVMYDLIVRCNSLPENTFALIEQFLKLPGPPRRYNWREENACGQYHEITVEIPLPKKPKPVGQPGGPRKASKPGQYDPKTLAKLKGRKVWVQVPGPEDAGWCELYEKAGLIVNCDTDNADQVKYDLIVRCPNLPSDTFQMIEKFNGLKMEPRRYDWRRENACGQYHEITVEIPIDQE